MNRFTLISFIGVDDSVLIRQLIEHHRLIGVTDFHLILHGNWPRPRLEYLSTQADVVIKEQTNETYSEALLRAKYNELIQGLLGEWIVLVDGDEFLEIPYSTLSQVAARMRSFGINELPAFLVQRLSLDGRLCDLDPETDINVQFPMMNFNLCEDLKVANPVWKDKFPFFFATSSCRSRRGNHVPLNGCAPANAPLRAVIHHFKWTAKFQNKLKNWTPGTGRGNDNEFSAYKKWLEEHDDRLPTSSSITYSREALFKQGLLVRPSAREHEIAATMAKAKRHRDAQEKIQIANRLERLARPFSDSHCTDRRFKDPRNLLLRPGRICFVTFELSGVTTSGGIGTAVGALAESLVHSGHEVSVVFSPFRGPSRIHDLWMDWWTARGIDLHYLPRHRHGADGYPRHLEFNEKLDAYLCGLNFDLIHFVDAGGYGGRYSRLVAAAGKSGVRIISTVHGPGDWHRRGNLIPWQDDEPFERAGFGYMLELSDFVIFPSKYMMDWTKARYRVQSDHGVIANILPGSGRSFSRPSPERRSISEVVFFGRIEPRKGFDTFCQAISQLSASLDELPAITVMGRLGERMTIETVFDAFGSLRDRVKVVDNYGSTDAINYLKTRDCVVIIPSKLDNLPYTVYEAVEGGIPVMTTAVGGIKDLIDEQDHERVLVASNHETLASALQDALENGFAPARLAFEASIATVEQLAVHARLVAKARGEVASAQERVRQNDSRPQEIHYGISVSRRAAPDQQGAHEYVNNWAAAANETVRQSGADLVFLLDQNVRLVEDQAATILQRLLTAGDYDVVVSDALISFGGKEWSGRPATPVRRRLVALGRPPELSPMTNIYGAGCLLIRRSCFLAVSGFCERLKDSQYAHWELLNRLMAAQYHIGAVPMTLVATNFIPPDRQNANPDHEFVEHLLRPWAKGLDFGRENMIRYSVQSLVNPHQLILSPEPGLIVGYGMRPRRLLRKLISRLRARLRTASS